MNVVNQYGEKWNGFSEVAVFCHVTCSYLTDFYYKELIEISAKPAFSIWNRTKYVRDIAS